MANRKSQSAQSALLVTREDLSAVAAGSTPIVVHMWRGGLRGSGEETESPTPRRAKVAVRRRMSMRDKQGKLQEQRC